jgi:cbb3-type cytochrome oxidase subunit 3
MLLVSESAATLPTEPMISFDTWGLIVIGVLVLVIWLAFRRMFPEDKKKKK